MARWTRKIPEFVVGLVRIPVIPPWELCTVQFQSCMYVYTPYGGDTITPSTMHVHVHTALNASLTNPMGSASTSA